ncbi:MAG: protein-L-isoaspartate(D-aspartate) O-methyltransferase [Pseudomonadota bacterium]
MGYAPSSHSLEPDERAEAQMQFVFGLRQAGVTDGRVLQAMEAVPRERYVGPVFRDRAYQDTALPISCGQTISQPAVVGRMTQALEVTQRCKVLEIGTGSGYQAAILARLARRVYTLERHKPLARAARRIFAEDDVANVSVIATDGAYGLPEQAPFDRILLTAAAEDPPAPLIAQLKLGGVMVLPVGQSDTVQTLVKVVKQERGCDYHSLGPVRFVPLLEGLAEDVAD